LKLPQSIVIPKRGFVARGICCFAAGSKQILAGEPGFGMTTVGLFLRN
jgi:hypothetical protein